MNRIPIKLMNPTAVVPTRNTEGSVGYDIYACLPSEVEIAPGETYMIGSGVAIALENEYAAFIYARSGLGVKHGIVPANCVGVIDSDYRGEIMVGIKNTSNAPYTIRPNERIAQMVICKCETPALEVFSTLDNTKRGSNGFGSSGIN